MEEERIFFAKIYMRKERKIIFTAWALRFTCFKACVIDFMLVFGNSLQFESYNYRFDGIGIYDFVDSDNLLSQ